MSDLNPFDDLDDDLNETGGDGGTDSNPVKQVREALKRERQRAKELETQLNELAAFKASIEEKQRDEVLTVTFKEVGLNEKHAALFKKLNPEAEITADAVRAFASEYELPTVSGDVVTPPEAPAPTGIRPVVTGSSAPDLGTVTIEDAAKLPPEEASRLLAAGRVERVPKDEGGSVAIDWLEGMR